MKHKTHRRHPSVHPAAGAVEADRGGFALILLRAALFGVALSLGLILVLSLIGAGAVFGQADPDAQIAPLSLAVLGLAALGGGFGAYRACRRAPLLCGLATGAGLLLVFFLVSYLFPAALRERWPASLRWGLRGGVPVFCILGALMASYTPKRRRRRR